MSDQNRFNKANAIASIICKNQYLVKPILAYFETQNSNSSQIKSFIELLNECCTDPDYFCCLRKTLRNIEQNDFEAVMKIMIEHGFVIGEFEGGVTPYTIYKQCETHINLKTETGEDWFILLLKNEENHKILYELITTS